MVFVRRRYYIWLFKAYSKRWKKTIIASILFGGIFFFLFFFAFSVYIQPVLEKSVEKIGISGFYTPENIPLNISSQLSYGLTRIDNTGRILPGAASSWEIKDKGKEYIFRIKPKQYFHNKEELTTASLSLNFKDVKRSNIDKYTVSYKLKSPYSPFLATVSKPIFIKGLIGLGDYKLKSIDLNAGFVRTFTIENKNDFRIKKILYFYPTEEALKIAFALGEINEINDVSNIDFMNTKFDSWKNIKESKSTDYTNLVSIFYNNNDNNLSNKKLRQSLNYALPETFSQGERASSPIPPINIYFTKILNSGIYDKEIAKTSLEGSSMDIKNINIEISTTKDYEDVAKIIQKSWGEIGIKSKIKIVSDVPDNFQVLLYSFNVPQDPDQYVLWHSDQRSNITHYKNLRIDKLLEDGRSITDIDERIKIYADFQKYLLDDVPASFLYFPYDYTVKR